MSESQRMPDTPFRLAEAERRLGKLEDRTEGISPLATEVKGLREALGDLKGEVKTLRMAIITAAISFAGGAVTLALSIILKG